MNIILNGKPAKIPDPLTARQLITHLGLGDKRLAMEVNLEIIPRSEYEQTPIQENDRVEIVQAIGGG